MINRVSSLILLVTDQCNLKCDYCYVNGHLSGSLTPADACRARELLPDLRHVAFGGGEPLIDLGALEDIRTALAEAGGSRTTFGLTTNGTLVDESAADWVAAHIDLVGLSIDGLSDASARHRLHEDGADSTPQALQALRLLLERDTEVTVAMTLLPDTIGGLAESLLELQRMGTSTVALNLAQKAEWSTADWSRLENELVRFRLERGTGPDAGRMLVHPLDRAITVLKGRRSRASCPGTVGVTLTASGQFMPCDAFPAASEPAEWQCGSLDTGPDMQKLLRIRELSRVRRTECRGCVAAPTCDRGCSCTHVLGTGRPDAIADTWCDFTKAVHRTAERLAAGPR